MTDTEQTIKYLTKTLNISKSLLAGLLMVSERQLILWSTSTSKELEDILKANRLFLLHGFVKEIIDFGVKKETILGLLHTQLHPYNEESVDMLYLLTYIDME